MTSSAFGSTGLSPVRFVSLSRFAQINLDDPNLDPKQVAEQVTKLLGTHKVEIDLPNRIAIVSG